MYLNRYIASNITTFATTKYFVLFLLFFGIICSVSIEIIVHFVFVCAEFSCHKIEYFDENISDDCLFIDFIITINEIRNELDFALLNLSMCATGVQSRV